jgi:hypothetical protein
VRLCFWTAATNGPIVHLLSYIWIWKATVEWCRQGKTPDSSIRALCKIYRLSHIVAKQEECSDGNAEFFPRSIFHTHSVHQHADGFTSSPNEVVLRILLLLKIPLSSAGFEPANHGSSCKHANRYTTEGNWCTDNSPFYLQTERRGRVVNTSSCSGGHGFTSRLGYCLSWLRGFVVFLSPSRLIPG